jgi:hypothetical protein
MSARGWLTKRVSEASAVITNSPAACRPLPVAEKRRSLSSYARWKLKLMSRITPPPGMFVLLAVSVFEYHVGIGLYYAVGLEPSLAFEFLYTVAFLCAVVWWIREEARRYKVTPVYCLGFLVSTGWMIVIPYHLYKTRGLKGFIPLVVLIAVFFAAQLVAGFLYLLLRHSAS